jgi:putative transposase
MAWDDIARGEHRRDGLRYPSDLSDAEWVLIAALLSGPRPGGRPRSTSLRDVVDAIHYMASSGCQWRMLPKDFPPVSTVQGYFYAWRAARLRSCTSPLPRLAKDWERSLESSTAWTFIASVRMLSRRVARLGFN